MPNEIQTFLKYLLFLVSMYSLNTATQVMVKLWWKGDIEVGWLLRETPKIYDSLDLGDSIGNLVNEIQMHSQSDRRRVKTTLEGGVQILELAWNGDPLPEHVLDGINNGYQEGAKLKDEPLRSGTRIAGYFLDKFKGKVRIENFRDELYVVRNIVELPLNYK